jgi:ATP-binding cassette subfamily A (ABC1) protein 5
MKGVPKENIQQAISFWSSAFDFSEHLDKSIQTCSGGTKRKVSAAISCIGKLTTVVLDGKYSCHVL